MKAPNRVNNLARLTKLFQSVPYRTALNDTTQHIRHPPQNATYMTRDPTAHDLDIMYTRFVRFRLRHYRVSVRVHTQKVTECSPLATLGHTHTHHGTHTNLPPSRKQHHRAPRTYLLSHWLLCPAEPLTSMLRAQPRRLPRETTTGPMPSAALALPLSQKVSTSPSPSRSSASSSSSCLAISRASSSLAPSARVVRYRRPLPRRCHSPGRTPAVIH